MRKHIERLENRRFIIRDISEGSSVSVTISPALSEEELRDELIRRGVLTDEAEGLIEGAKLQGTRTSFTGFTLRT
ncbi:MAG: hypothetical protein WB680_16050 [Candidatus Acidiferrales bacterium]